MGNFVNVTMNRTTTELENLKHLVYVTRFNEMKWDVTGRNGKQNVVKYSNSSRVINKD